MRGVRPGDFEEKCNVSAFELDVEKRTVLKFPELRPTFYNRLFELNSIFFNSIN